MKGTQVITPIDMYIFSFKDKRKVQELFNLINYYIYGKIKERTCADGSKQRVILSK